MISRNLINKVTISLFIVLFGHPASAAIIDVNAPVVQLRDLATGGCVEAGNTLNNCFTSMADLVNWINSTRKPNASKPLLVNIGPGQFTGFSCLNGGYTTLRGAGRSNTTIGGPTDYVGVSVSNCTKLDFQDLKVTHKTNAFNTVFWQGSGTSNWSNVDVIGGSYAWVDTDSTTTANSCSLAGRSTHYWFSSRIVATTDVGLTKGYIAQCSISWFFGSEITASVTAAGSADSIALRVSNNYSEAHVYGSVIRAISPAGISAPLVAVHADNGGAIHIHGTGIDVISVEPSPILALTASGNGMIHANEAAYNLSTGAGGTITRVSNSGGHIHAPYLWAQHSSPPAVATVRGADMAVEDDCAASGCQSVGSETHLLISNDSCTGAGGPWFDVVTGRCR